MKQEAAAGSVTIFSPLPKTPKRHYICNSLKTGIWELCKCKENTFYTFCVSVPIKNHDKIDLKFEGICKHQVLHSAPCGTKSSKPCDDVIQTLPTLADLVLWSLLWQACSVTDHSLSEELFLNAQSELALMQLHSISSCLITSSQREETSSSSPIAPLEKVIDCDKVTPQLSLLQAEQTK